MKLSRDLSFLFFFFLGFLCSCGKKGEDPHKIPVCIQKDFDIRFTNASHIAWETEDIGVFKGAYHVSFVKDNVTHNAFYDTHCTLLQYAFTIDMSLAPVGIAQYINIQYPESKGMALAKVFDYTTGKEVLSFIVKLTQPAVILSFDNQGNYLSSKPY